MSPYDCLIFSVEQIESFTESICSTHDAILLSSQGLNVSTNHSYGLVESVVAANFSMYYDHTPAQLHGFTDIFDQVAHFATQLSTDHPFPDANKRTTVVTSVSLLYQHGIGLSFTDDPDPVHNTLYQWIQDIVERKIPIDVLSHQLRTHAFLIEDTVYKPFL
ncbi:death-on-curing protein [Alloscardovia theropitheci]|uniref:Death-on-curing protein n=1 Tax=Alloscardovia theropitheci TaxID=2496842 RepID=A0A4R0QZ48_9BIFI|nr:Fic family protein [Alloscardovia theropitheci]TCD53846.1 death-on-curing protein [Alloscardovia theropitheci]